MFPSVAKVDETGNERGTTNVSVEYTAPVPESDTCH